MNKAFKVLLVSISLFILPAFMRAHTYIMRVKLPENLGMAKAPGLKAYYKGCPILLDELCAILPESDNPLTISLLVIQDGIDFHGTNNSIRYLKRQANKQCRWFDLTLLHEHVSDTEQDTYRWTVNERTSEEVPTRIPENTVILFFDPELIEVQAREAEFYKHGVVSMPLITFKRDINQDVFNDALLYSTLANLDLDAVHRAKDFCQTRCDAAVISLAI